MRTHYAILRRTGRPVPVERIGRIMLVQGYTPQPLLAWGYTCVSGPIPVDDPRFRLMPRDWTPPPGG
jgi:hypothetical protein